MNEIENPVLALKRGIESAAKVSVWFFALALGALAFWIWKDK